MFVRRALGSLAATALAAAGIVALAPPPARAATIEATLVATRPTSTWARPSSDPAGITYHAPSGRLLISDSEVDETPLYAGTNLFLSTLDGQQTADDPGGTTVPWSSEPAGVGYRPRDGRLFVSDDDLDQVFEVRPGPDGRYGTADDGVTSFSTRSLGAGDAEDVAVDMEVTADNHVLVIDGGTKKVYDFGPGPNGVFDGQPADGGDDTVTVIDVGRFGALDPEGVAYHASRTTILALDGASRRIFELNRQGQLLNIVSIQAAQPRKAAGMTLAPASDGSGAQHVYIVDRGVDNDTNPQQNDGRFYEMALALPPIGPPTNVAPRVVAGDDVAVSLPASASLSGWADDDALPAPPAAVSVTWSTVSGPGTVGFADPSAVATTASFSTPGTYVLRLTADDGELQASDELTAVVYQQGSGSLDVPVAGGEDDAEERSASTSVTGADLELVTDGSTVQTVGLRFPGLAVPPGATVTQAYVQFSADETTGGAANLVVAGQAADTAAGFSTAARDISSRPRTTATVGWVPAPWTRDDRGAEQRTPDLSPIVQEIVSRPGWASGNAQVLVVTGSGTRTATASEQGAATAPVLHVEFSSTPPGPVNAPPSSQAGADVAVTQPAAATLAGSVSDDGLPNPPGAVTATWSTGSGPGTVTFADPAAPSTTATFSAAGTYVLRLTADDGQLRAHDDVTVTVSPEPPPPPPPPPGAVDVPIAVGTDDGEERSASVSLTGTDLELVVDGTTVQTVGLRFAGVAVPAGAVITSAYVQFSVDEASTATTSVTVAGQAADDAAAFAAASKDISSRPRTAARVTWVPEPWPTRGDRGAAQRTPDLSAVVQEIVARAGWAPGNDVVLVVTGSGTRTAAAAERGGARVPVLHVEWTMPGAG